MSENIWALTVSCFAHSEEDNTECDMDWRDLKSLLVPKRAHDVQGLILLDDCRWTPSFVLCISKCPSKGSVTIVTHSDRDL